MPLYVSLETWTDQGVRNYRGTVERADAFRNLVQQAGGQVRELLWTMGDYDVVTIIEAPDDETVSGLMLQASALGNIRTKTLKALDADQMANIISRTS
jgi:uncharacterized protein with GYD domain